jgi:hypothetical protein
MRVKMRATVETRVLRTARVSFVGACCLCRIYGSDHVTFRDRQPPGAKNRRLAVRMEPEANSAARNEFVVARADNGNVRALQEYERDPGSLIRRNRYGDLVRIGAFDVARIHGGDHVVVDLAVRHCGI